MVLDGYLMSRMGLKDDLVVIKLKGCKKDRFCRDVL